MKISIQFALFLLAISSFGQKVIPLYQGSAPGSETWSWDEQENSNNLFNTRVVYNVSKPTLTAFIPSSWSSNGTAVVICPGGGFQTLSIDIEGNDVAKWLNQRGIAAFVLKYRLVRSLTDDPVKELMGKMSAGKLDGDNASVIPLTIADGKKAMEYVRSHAGEFNINPNRIGLMGFSAGGTVAAAIAYSYTKENRPDFVAPIYPYMGAIPKTPLPADAPPLFIAAASDDQLGLAPHSIQLYSDWIASKKSAELHMYKEGGHGFGMRQQDLPSDSWIDRFGDWLAAQKLTVTDNPNHWTSKFTPQQLLHMKKEYEQKQAGDWANLKRFQEANLTLSPPKPNENRVVFMGNSITEGWGNIAPEFFAGKPYINRGISGQTTPQMLVRFRQDVVNLKPKVVVILAGTNDIAGNTGPMTLQQTVDNIISMAQLAKANNIKVVISSILPAFDYPWKPGLEPAEKIFTINTLLKDFANKNKCVYLDYFTSMSDERKGLKKELGYDGVHPNLAGYKIMAPLAEKAIAEALKIR